MVIHQELASRDISEIVACSKSRYSECLETLSKYAIRLLEVKTSQELFQLVADQVHQITGDTSVIVSEFDLPSYSTIVREVKATPQRKEKIQQLFQRNLEGMSFRFADDIREIMKPGELNVLTGGVHQLTFNQIPVDLSHRLEQELQITQIYAMPFDWDRDILGTVAILLHSSNELKNRPLVESMVTRAALALERLRVERELFETKERYRTLFDHANEGILYSDASGKVILVNQKISDITGYSQNELIGQPLLSFVPIEFHDELKEKMVQRRQGIKGDYDQQLQKKGGGFVWVHINASPITDAEGNFIGNLGMLHDITERKRTEVELAQIIQYAPTAIFEIDYHTGRFSRVNEAMCALLGYTHDELLAMSPFDLLDEEYSKRFQSRLDRVLAGKEVASSAEYKVFDKQGRIHWAELNVTFIRENGRVIGESVIAHDVTERRHYEEELRKSNTLSRQRSSELAQANKELEAFSYSVSHDLKAPLRSINGFSQILYEEYHGKLDASAKEYIDRIRHSTKWMADLIDDLLQLSRISRADIHIEPVNLSEIAKDILKDLRGKEPGRNVELSVTEGVKARGDPDLLRILLKNLLDNAWKFTGKTLNPQIAFGVLVKNHEQIFFVRDNGAGFDMKYADKLFIAFQRLHDVEKYPGNGIGLALAARIVNRHGGRIWADGEVEKGATFYFTLDRK
jgi:PAS domain S-box-containing protein